MDPAALLVDADAAKDAVPITACRPAGLDQVLSELSPRQAAWAKANNFKAESGRALVCPDAQGGVEQVLFGLGSEEASDPFLPGKLAKLLPPGRYSFAGGIADERLAALGFMLEAYDFDRYRAAPAGSPASLAAPNGVDAQVLRATAAAVTMVRDLVNTPANDLGPAELEAAARSVAERHGAAFNVTVGEALKQGFPLIHAVGQASSRAPRLIDFTFGDAAQPKLTLVGKGVTFDTGGLDIKPSSNMLLMKKDMGGAANVLGLAAMIMEARLPVRLRVVIPTVDNAISGSAFRPGDILKSRKGLSVEIGNTDAEGRLILADALTLADEEAPDLLIDMATLTGAARVALGPDLPAFYTDDVRLADGLARHAVAENDPLWRLPLWRPYNALFESKIADLNNAGSSGFAGSITAALFLRRFVERARSYTHFDIFAWTPMAKPGRPVGGEAQAIRALFALINERFSAMAPRVSRH
jgi:leucyl aminopeptidase